jgi:hypothetical protein
MMGTFTGASPDSVVVAFVPERFEEALASTLFSLRPNMKVRRRHPLVQIGLLVLVCLVGIGSRRYPHVLPRFVAAYAGDTLWALAAFLGIGLILPRTSTRTISCLAIAFSVAIEISQLYHAPWIDSIRQTTLGGLILGFGFLWSDMACYAVGVGLGVIMDLWLCRRPPVVALEFERDERGKLTAEIDR